MWQYYLFLTVISVNPGHTTSFITSSVTPFFILKNDLYVSKVTFFDQPEEICVPLFLAIFQSFAAFREHT